MRALYLVERHHPVTELVAKKVIEMCQNGITEPAQLTTMALKALGCSLKITAPQTSPMRKTSRSWTDEDIQKLQAMVAKGASALRTGVVLKRPTLAVKQKARALGLQFPRATRFSIDRINGR